MTLRSPKKLLAVALTLLLAGMASGWTPGCKIGKKIKQIKKGESEAKAYEEHYIERGDVVIKLTANGVITPRAKVEIKSEVGGKVKNVFVQVGDAVKAGQKIIELEDRDLRIELKQAEASMESARARLQQVLDRPQPEQTLRYESNVRDAELQVRQNAEEAERLRSLYAKGFVSKAELDRVEYGLQNARNRLDTAREDLKILKDGPLESEIQAAEADLGRARAGYEQTLERLKKTVILSPIDGAVLARSAEPGATVSPGVQEGGSAMLTIADTATLFFEGSVDETDVLLTKTGLPASVKILAREDVAIPGRVSSIAPLGEKEENITRFDVEVELEELPEWLEAGMSADAEITSSKKEGVLLMNLQGAYYWEGVAYVYGPPMTKDGGTTTYTPTLGIDDGVNVEIVDGLTEGQAYFYYADTQ